MQFLIDLAHSPFLKRALTVALLASIACGITGSYVVKKRLTFIAGSLAHAILGGIGIAYFLGADTTLGAVIFALFFSGVLTLTKLKAGEQEDTVIGVLWALGMSIGIIFMHLTPGYNQDLMSFIFGNILMVEPRDIKVVLLMDGVVIATAMVLYHHFLYISFDEDFLVARGLRAGVWHFLLLTLIALTIVILIKIMGLILVIALLTLPAVIAAQLTRTFGRLMLWSSLLGMIFTGSGILLAYELDLPASASIIIFASLVYLLVLTGKRVLGK